MLRKLRIGISALLFVLISFFFLDFAEILPNSFHRLAHLQFIPAVLSLSIGILLFLIVLTLLFGRVYCSTICPMGILQDVIARISKSTGKKKKRYSYSPTKNKLRWGVLGLTVIGFSMRIYIYCRPARSIQCVWTCSSAYIQTDLHVGE